MWEHFEILWIGEYQEPVTLYPVFSKNEISDPTPSGRVVSKSGVLEKL